MKRVVVFRSTNRVRRYRWQRGARAVVRQLWGASLDPWLLGVIIRPPRNTHHLRLIRACNPEAMNHRNHPRPTTIYPTEDHQW